MTTAEAAETMTPHACATSKRKRFKPHFPTAYTILFIITIIAVAATWLVPAGAYSKVSYLADTSELQIVEANGDVRTIPATQEAMDQDPELANLSVSVEQFTNGSITKAISIPGTYEAQPQNPAQATDITVAMAEGVVGGADVMVFILILGGLIGVVNLSGAFESGLLRLTKKTKGHEFLLVFIVALLMVLGGTSCGLEEEAVAFYPILVPIFLAMGFDSIVCVGAIFLASSMGTSFSTINPFSVVIASNAAGTTFTAGMEWRIAGCAVGAVVVIAYLWWYCRKIKANPAASYTYEDREHFARLFDPGSAAGDGGAQDFNWRKKLILVLFVASFVVMVWGVMTFHWSFPQMGASFLAFAIVIMALSGKGEKRCLDAFVNGASSLVGVSLIIGLARGVNQILEQGLVSDTLLYWCSNAVAGMQGPLFIVMLMLVFFLLGFIVPSSSGLAVLAMPIFAPLADTVGIDRSVIVSAYNWGQYAMLYLAPTGLVMATLTMLDMKYTKWLKFVWPMVVFLLVFGSALLVAQVMLA